MTDTTVDEGEPSTILRIPVPKAKSYIELDTAKLPMHVYQEFLVQGGKTCVNRGQTTLTKERYPDPEELQAAAMEKAEAMLEDLYAGKIRIAGAAKEGKVSREVMTAARNIARKIIKETLKRNHIKVTQVKASDITKLANAMLASDPKIIERAKKEQAEAEQASEGVDVSSIKVDPGLVAAQARKKADKTLSAKQADRVTSRVRH